MDELAKYIHCVIVGNEVWSEIMSSCLLVDQVTVSCQSAPFDTVY